MPADPGCRATLVAKTVVSPAGPVAFQVLLGAAPLITSSLSGITQMQPLSRCSDHTFAVGSGLTIVHIASAPVRALCRKVFPVQAARHVGIIPCSCQLSQLPNCLAQFLITDQRRSFPLPAATRLKAPYKEAVVHYSFDASGRYCQIPT